MLEELSLEIDDVRWYLAGEEARRMLTYVDRSRELAELIWSGKLEAQWYRMEERFVEELQQRLDDGSADEPEVRKVLNAVERAKRARYASSR